MKKQYPIRCTELFCIRNKCDECTNRHELESFMQWCKEFNAAPVDPKGWGLIFVATLGE